MGVFDKILESIPDSDRAFFDKYPQVRQQVEAIEESLRLAKAAAEENDAAVKAWEEYLYGAEQPDGTRQGGVWDDSAKNFKPVIEAQREIEQYRRRVSDLEKLVEAGTDMTFDEILANLQQRGFVTRDQIEPLQKAVQSSAKQEDINRVAGAFEFFYANTADLPAKHLAEFGEPMNFREYLEFVRKQNLIADPQRAYDMFVAGRRQEILKAQEEKKQQEIQEQIEKARQAGLEEGKRLAAMGQSGIPTDQDSGVASYNPAVAEVVQKAAKPDGTVAVPPEARLGDGVRAAIAAQLFKQGKLGGTVQ